MNIATIEKRFDAWFGDTVGKPTRVQRVAWPVLRERRNALLLAPTGQGKSLAAWRPVVERLAACRGSRGVRALHIAPLKALARDMTLNLAALLEFAGTLRGQALTIALRCGDTSVTERARQRRRPPEILSTTPETLFVLLGSPGGRRMLAQVGTVVLDELHALVSAKRGAHLALSLARLDALIGRPVQRIGLSATARPADDLARFLTGGADCAVIEPNLAGVVDLRLELPEMDLGPYPNTLHWQQIHARIAALAATGGSILVFCQTRAQVERSAAALDELLADSARPGQVGAHHGSLDAAHREQIEARFKDGRLRVLVSSASLELGLDLGHVDRVCQLGVPGSINLVRQRAGRSGHRPNGRPCLHLFPLTLNQLIEAGAVDRALAAGTVDALEPAGAPLDVLAQQLAAMAMVGGSSPEELGKVVRRAWPYRATGDDVIEALLGLLAEPVAGMPGPQNRPLLMRDGRGGFLPGPDAQGRVLTNAGVIPEFFEYDVLRADTGERVGRLDEEFAFESAPGQVIQLGHRAWRILRVHPGEVRVEPADEDPPHLPFWFGEGAGRTPEMAAAMLECIEGQSGRRLHPSAVAMLAASKRVLGALPSARRLVVECFADPGGDRHLVLHTFAGARINRAWGLALRKRFCRQFNFELQAAATDDGILISLGVTSHFELADVLGFVRAEQVEEVLTQALLDTPMFLTRFRWCANNALILLRNDWGGRMHAQRQRSQAENLVACVFPDQLACLENLAGARQVPDHPLVRQALADCLHDYMDLCGLKRLLTEIERGTIEVHAVHTEAPSALALALIHAPRHSYLDDAAAEERRTRSFEAAAPRTRPASRHRDRLVGGDRAARQPVTESIARRSDAGWPALRAAGSGQTRPDRSRMGQRHPGFALSPDADSLESLLMQCGYLTTAEGEAGLGIARPIPPGGWSRSFSALVRQRRAFRIAGGAGASDLWVAAERLGWFLALDSALDFRPWISTALITIPAEGKEVVGRWLKTARRRVHGDRGAISGC